MAVLVKAIDRIHQRHHMHCPRRRPKLDCIAEEVAVALVLLDPVEADLDGPSSPVEVAAEAVAVQKDCKFAAAAVDDRVEKTSRSHTARFGPDIGGSSSPREMSVTNE